jgi:hypothetical protein
MTTKTKTPPRTTSLLQETAQAGPWQQPPWTTEERLERIQAMAQRINGYVEYMCKVGDLNGTSAEAKHNAVVTFYERMVILERQLGRIQEDLRLG